MPQVSFITSDNGDKFVGPVSIKQDSNYGLQMAPYRGELYGVMTKSDNHLAVSKFKADDGWKSFRSLPDKFKGVGRVSVTVLDDVFYVAYRGTNDHTYLVATSNFADWADFGRVGSRYAKTKVSPAIEAYKGQLYITGVGEDKYIYYTVVNSDGSRAGSWKKIEGTGTRSALSMAVHDGRLWLLHTSYTNKQFFFQVFTGEGSWSDLGRVPAQSIHSGLSTTSWKLDELFVTYKSEKGGIMYQTYKVGDKKWSGEETVSSDVKMGSQTGLSTFMGYLVISFGDKDADSSSATRGGYRFPAPIMSEKGMIVHEEEVQDWDCKWDQQRPAKKSMLRRFFCM